MTARAFIEVLAGSGAAQVQDGGRRGHMHEGVPPGGALSLDRLARANLAVGNPHGTAAIEIHGSVRLRALGETIRVALDGEPARELGMEPIDVTPTASHRARYLAVAGGVDVPRVLDGCGTLVVASIGGFLGRALRRGDRIPVAAIANIGAAPPVPPTVKPPSLDDDAPIRVILGPDLDRFLDGTAATLLCDPYRVSTVGDRSGVRLEGPPLRRRDDDRGGSSPMVQGALQVPPSGLPILLGPDHPTTGGYPIAAVVIRADRDRALCAAPGVELRFRAVTVEEAREAFRARRAALAG